MSLPTKYFDNLAAVRISLLASRGADPIRCSEGRSQLCIIHTTQHTIRRDRRSSNFLSYIASRQLSSGLSISPNQIGRLMPSPAVIGCWLLLYTLRILQWCCGIPKLEYVRVQSGSSSVLFGCNRNDLEALPKESTLLVSICSSKEKSFRRMLS
ncbi:hypothetical protein DFH29DRAFT_949576, partial [Suillus ampliporus]